MAIYIVCVWVFVIRRDTRIESVDGVAPGGVAPDGVAPKSVASGGVAPGGVAPGSAVFLWYKTTCR